MNKLGFYFCFILMLLFASCNDDLLINNYNVAGHWQSVTKMELVNMDH